MIAHFCFTMAAWKYFNYTTFASQPFRKYAARYPFTAFCEREAAFGRCRFPVDQIIPLGAEWTSSDDQV
jgi:hypothetical protein